jgi:hypothetical protein
VMVKEWCQIIPEQHAKLIICQQVCRRWVTFAAYKSREYCPYLRWRYQRCAVADSKLYHSPTAAWSDKPAKTSNSQLQTTNCQLSCMQPPPPPTTLSDVQREFRFLGENRGIFIEIYWWLVISIFYTKVGHWCSTHWKLHSKNSNLRKTKPKQPAIPFRTPWTWVLLN